MTPSKRKTLKPKEVYFETSNKDDNLKLEIPNDESKLFDEEDDVGNSTIADLSLPSEVEEEELKLEGAWEYAINDLFQLSPVHAEGKSLRNWVKFQEMNTIEQFFQWVEQDITIGRPQTSYKDITWGKDNLEFQETNSIKNLHML